MCAFLNLPDKTVAVSNLSTTKHTVQWGPTGLNGLTSHVSRPATVGMQCTCRPLKAPWTSPCCVQF